jgi:hypothetical protein
MHCQFIVTADNECFVYLQLPRQDVERCFISMRKTGKHSVCPLVSNLAPLFVEPETAPYPLPSILHQSPFNR